MDVRGQGLRLDQAAIEEARGRVPIVELVARRVKLRRAGRGWNGLCPFHDEKSPSFTVSNERGFYHCFGCGAHGSAIDWMMLVEGVGFVEAVTRLLGGRLRVGDGRGAAAAQRFGYAGLIITLMFVLGGVKCAYDANLIRNHDASVAAKTAKADRKADNRAAGQRMTDQQRRASEAAQIKETIDEAHRNWADPRAAYYECVRRQQAARRSGQPSAGC